MRQRHSPLLTHVIGVFSRHPAILLSVLALVFYIYTLAPSLNWADSARMQMDVRLGGSSYANLEEVSSIKTDGWPFDRLGVAAWDHPLYVELGQLFLLFPVGDPAYRINLMSAVMATAAIWVTYRLIFAVTRTHWATWVGVGALVVSHTFWLHSVTTEVYTLNILLMALLVKYTIRWMERKNWPALHVFALVAGLGTANHRLFPLAVFPAAAFILASVNDRREFLRQLFGKQGLQSVCLFIVGFSPWWVQFIRMARIISVPLTWELAGTFSLIGSRLAWSWNGLALNLLKYLGWLLYQFTPLGLWLGILGIRWMHKKHTRIFWLLSITFIVHVTFSANFSVLDQFDFHLPSYWIFSFFIACGARHLQDGFAVTKIGYIPRLMVQFSLLAGVVLLPISLYAAAPGFFQRAGLTEQDFGIFPIGAGVRDTARYFLNPNKRGDDSAAQFGKTTMDMLAPQALVLTPKTSEQEAYIVLRYFQRVERMRPDVRLDMMLFTPINNMPEAVLAEIQSHVNCRPIYITSLNPKSFPKKELEDSFEILPEANLFRVIPRTRSNSQPTCPAVEKGVRKMSFQELILLALRWP